jgi:hypothetical protein
MGRASLETICSETNSEACKALPEIHGRPASGKGVRVSQADRNFKGELPGTAVEGQLPISQH